MARPKREPGVPDARQRLADAFWDMLSEMPFSEMTVLGISARAQVNHNSFYYHFRNIEDMAQTLFRENMLPEMPRLMLPFLLEGSGRLPELSRKEREVLEAHFMRARLFAQSGSPFLTGILEDSIRDLWLQTYGLEESDLDRTQVDQLVFVFGGLVALIAEMGDDVSSDRMAAFVQSPAGRGVVSTLSAIAGSAREDNRMKAPGPSI